MLDTYITISGDTWDIISYRAYGDGAYMDVLIKANMQYKDVYVFPAGIELEIPEIDPELPDTLPPWKQGVEEYE